MEEDMMERREAMVDMELAINEASAVLCGSSVEVGRKGGYGGGTKNGKN
jgi:hypothetical protein